MLKSVGMMIMSITLIFLTACGEDTKPKKEPTTGANTPTNSPSKVSPQNTETMHPNETPFKAELSINLKSYQDQLSERDLPALQVLEKNLTALIKHDYVLFKFGFANKKIADAMEPYYGEQFECKFTDIESIDQDLPNEQVNITVIGKRLDTTAETVEDVKMLYAIRPSDQGEWGIYTID